MDTVVVTAPDNNNAVLTPTLSDAIAAVQYYWLLVQAAETSVLAAETQVNIATAEALQAAQSALVSATNAASSASGGTTLPTINQGSPTMATRVHLLRALYNVDAGVSLQTVNDYVMANYNSTDPTALEWTDANFFPITSGTGNGLVYTLIINALGYTAIQANNLWNAAYAILD